MRQLFYITLLLIALYLGLDVLIRGEEKGDRPIVQLIAGASLGAMLIYNVYYSGKKYSVLRLFNFLKIWLIFTAVGVLYMFLAIIEFPSQYADINLRFGLIMVYIITTIIFFYNATINGHLKGKLLDLLIYFLVFNGAYEVFIAFNSVDLKMGVEIINTSAGYMFLMLLPMLMYRYQKQNFWLFSVAILFTLMSGKRGALITFVFLIVYALSNFKRVFKNFKFDWKAILFLVILFAIGFYFVEYAYDSLTFRLANIENEERGTIGSGRDVIWLTLITFWLDGSFFNQLFGYGFYSAYTIEGHIAHNDFIEYLIDFGILGFLLWSIIMTKFYKNIKRVKKYDSYLYIMLLFCFLILLGRGIFAGTNRTDQIVFSISLGYLLGVTYLKYIRLKVVNIENKT